MKHSGEYEVQEGSQSSEETWRLQDLLDLEHPRGRQAFVTFAGSSVLASATGIGFLPSLGVGVVAAVGMDRLEGRRHRQAE